MYCLKNQRLSQWLAKKKKLSEDEVNEESGQ